jgi:hypothetical protein
MKVAIIIDTYPSGHRELQVLKRCIGSYADADVDIIVATHYPIKLTAIPEADYVIYDKNNEFLPAQYTPFYWFENSQFRVEINNAGHTLPICRNMNNALRLCQSLKHEWFIFTEADVILNETDRARLFEMVSELKTSGKNMLFFKPEHFRECNSHVYETLLFAGNVNYFLNTFQPPMNLAEWMATPMGYTLELSFFERFSKDEETFQIINEHSSTFFKDSEVNILRYGLINNVLLQSNNPDKPIVLFISNALTNGNHITAYVNGTKVILHPKEHYLNSFDVNFISVALFDHNEEHLQERLFDLTNPKIQGKILWHFETN